MLEYSQGEIGWDVFTLEYKVDAPLDTVLDPDSMVKYLKLFNHLWKMKRIESTMTKGWARTAGATKAFVRIPGKFSRYLNHYGIDILKQSWNQNGIKFA